jgi:hypothetical protein
MRDFSPSFVYFYYQNLVFFLKKKDMITLLNWSSIYPVILKELTFIGNARRRPKFTIHEA